MKIVRVAFGTLVVVGIAAAIVLPQYGDYTHRSQSAEAVSLLAGAKTPLAEYFACAVQLVEQGPDRRPVLVS